MNPSPLVPTLPADLWRQEESLCRAAALITKNAARVRAVSFDFFDTLVWRLVAKPTDAFREVGRRLHARQLLRPHIPADDFESLRRVAELKMRERQKMKDPTREDITLAEIYQHLQPVLTDPVLAAEVEFDVERELCLINPVMVSFLQHLHQRGFRILVISDIYFSAAQLRGILQANGFDTTPLETILTSCDAGLCKSSGNLFRHALKILQLDASQLLHVGDNALSDVAGARRAGVRGCHYPQTDLESAAILEREQFLAGGQSNPLSLDSLRLLAARQYPGPSAGAFFSRSGAFLLGPLLTRYATWACDQFVAAGVRKVGAFMREGEMLGALLQQENAARGLGLDIMPLYVNRKSTDLAAIGKLSAENIVTWLERRQTLPIQTILEHFGMTAADVRLSGFRPDEKVDAHERILKLAKFLFTPAIASRIEERSAEERRKVIDYLQPWIGAKAPVGLCDLGYNASAQLQLKRILELEGHPARLIGCYLVTCERAAVRLLDGLDIRHFLGAFGRPNYHYFAFLRSPAFIEQCLSAPTGTTLGYHRASDGSVTPILDEMRFPPELLRCQRGFKDGVLLFQKLWLWFRSQKPALLDGATTESKALLAGLDHSCATILSRVTAFPLTEELAHFSTLPLDDYYFAEGVKTICSPFDREIIREQGYPKLLTESGVLWPQGAFHLENPQIAADFFSCGKALLLCNSAGSNANVAIDVAVIIPPQPTAAALRECLTWLKPAAGRIARCGILILAGADDRETMRTAQEFRREFKWFQVTERLPGQTLIQQINHAVDESTAPIIAVIDGLTPLAPDWDIAMLEILRTQPEVAIIFPCTAPAAPRETTAARKCLNDLPPSFVVRHSAYTESLGFHDKLGIPGGTWNLLFHLRADGWQAAFSPASAGGSPTANASRLPASDLEILTQAWPDWSQRIAAPVAPSPAQPASDTAPVVAVDWIGSFLDHGSLSHVNRELTAALAAAPGINLRRVAPAGPAAEGLEDVASQLSATPSAAPAVTVRHAWPPDWQRPISGKLVVIQPWEFGSLPEDWVKNATRVDEFWVPSEYVRRVYAESGVPADKVRVVPNGVNLETFAPHADPMTLLTNKKFKFLFVGGTIFRKGPDILLKAYLENFTAADDVCLVIKDFGGEGVYAGQTLQSQIQEAQAALNCPEILYLDTDLPPADLPGLYTACDCLVLPYRGEGFGLPVLEAMACGLPVIVTAGGATDDFVRDDFGWRIPAERTIFGQEISGMKLTQPGWLLEPDGPALGRLLRTAVADPAEARRRGLVAAVHTRKFYSWEKSAALAGQRLEELARGTGQRSVGPTGAAPLNKKIVLPPTAYVGHLAEAHELIRQKKSRAAWEFTLAALAKRPFHPEAFLLLAEIAQAVGAGQVATHCAEHARRMAPEWKPARKFLNQRRNGSARPEWLKLPPALQQPAAETTPGLTVCLIVKNEEKFLGQCLKSIRDLATQIVVVDTGSTDQTVAIAQGHGAEVHTFVWGNDFSAARNAALEHVTGDWVLVLDADEELSAEGREKIKAALLNPTVMAWRLPLIDIGREANGRTYVPRLFRNAPGLFYLGRIHEQVFSSIEVRRAEWGLENRLGDAPLIHYGYTPEMMRDRNKVQRNLLLLERAVEEMPGEPHLLMHLALELARSNRTAEALNRDLEAFNCLAAKPAREIVPELRETLLLQLGTHLTAAKRFEEIVRVLTSPLATMGEGLTASLHFSLGLALFELRRFSESADHMRQCLAKRGQPTLSLVNAEINSAAPHHCLALSLSNAGHTVTAEQAFQQGLREPGAGTLQLDYARFLAGQNRPVEALQQLHQAVTRNAQTVEAWRLGGQIALTRAEFLKFARDWTGEAIKHLPEDPIILVQRAEVLMLGEDLAGARGLWEKSLDLGAGSSAEPTVLAALILCELVETATTHEPRDRSAEAATSTAFIKWYRKMLAVKANKTVLRLNAETHKLARALPGAARILESAMGEASRAAAAVGAA